MVGGNSFRVSVTNIFCMLCIRQESCHRNTYLPLSQHQQASPADTLSTCLTEVPKGAEVRDSSSGDAW